MLPRPSLRPGGSPSTLYPNLLVHHDRCEQRARPAIGDRVTETETETETEFRHGLETRFGDAAAYALDEKSKAGISVDPGSTSLTRRERQVAEFVAEGLTNRALVISQRTAQAAHPTTAR